MPGSLIPVCAAPYRQVLTITVHFIDQVSGQDEVDELPAPREMHVSSIRRTRFGNTARTVVLKLGGAIYESARAFKQIEIRFWRFSLGFPWPARPDPERFLLAERSLADVLRRRVGSGPLFVARFFAPNSRGMLSFGNRVSHPKRGQLDGVTVTVQLQPGGTNAKLTVQSRDEAEGVDAVLAGFVGVLVGGDPLVLEDKKLKTSVSIQLK
jgi:hypothetical protein